MGGLSGGSTSGSNSGNNAGNYSGTSQSTPNVTPTWSSASSMLLPQVGASGLTAPQSQALNAQSTLNANNPTWAGLTANNAALNGIAGSSAPTNSGTSQVVAPTAASMISPYLGLTSQALIDPSLQNYDYGTAIGQNTLNSQQAGGGGFNDSRGGVAQGTFDAQSALGRGQLASQLLTQGLDTAIGAGQSDAANSLTASGQNAGNTLSSNLANQQAALTQENMAVNALGQNTANYATSNNIFDTNTADQYNMGGGGLTNLAGILGTQVPGFGTTGTQSGNYTGTSSGVNSGSQIGAQLGK